MIKQVRLSNFRGLKEINLLELKQINLISGKNNAGKSSILEGVFLLFDHTAPESFIKINQFRGLPVSSEPHSIWEPSFYNMDTDNSICISVGMDHEECVLEYTRDNDFVPTDSGGAPKDVWKQIVSSAKSTYSLKFCFNVNDYMEEGHFVVGPSGILRNVNTNNEDGLLMKMPFVQYINSSMNGNDDVVTEWFGQLEIHGKKQQIIDILRILEPSILDVSTIAFRGQTQLYAKMDSKLLPLKLAGDGLNKLLFIILAIVKNPDSIILIDEIESGFHYSMYPKLWNVIACAAKENHCQIIATTHSYECIDGAVAGIEKADMQEDFCFYRVEKSGNANKAFRYSGKLLHSAIDSSMEVR